MEEGFKSKKGRKPGTKKKPKQDDEGLMLEDDVIMTVLGKKIYY